VLPDHTPEAPNPDPPEHLGPAGRAAWVTVWGTGRLEPADHLVATRYAELTDTRHEVRAILTTEGLTTTGSKGQTVAHPLVAILRDLDNQARQLEDRLLLSPRARKSVAALVKPGPKLTEFLTEAAP
jgi:P27 family predicted phage terminase small subunit